MADYNGLLSGLINNPLLAMGAGMLDPRGTYGSFGASLNKGLVAGSVASQQAQQMALAKMQMDAVQRERDREEARQARIEQFRKQAPQLIGTPGGQPLAGPVVPGAAPLQTQPSGLYQTNPQAAGLLSGMMDVAPVQTGQTLLDSLMNPKTDQQTSNMRNYAALRQLGLSHEAAMNRAFSGGVTVNVGQADKQVPVSELKDLMNEAGQHPPLGTSYADAIASGYKVRTPAEQTQRAGASGALGFVDKLESLAFNPRTPVFRDYSGMWQRMQVGGGNLYSTLAQDNPTLEQYRSLADSGLSIIVRSLGEKGTLAEGDISRLKKAIPQVYPLPDKPEVAKQKLQNLRQIINEVSGRTAGSVGDPIVDTVIDNGKTYYKHASGQWSEGGN